MKKLLVLSLLALSLSGTASVFADCGDNSQDTDAKAQSTSDKDAQNLLKQNGE